ncbi:MAG: type II toxin-antitoxin system RelE/ParE family toxin [Chitinivibrionales bacterium]|nr:type II toxin-antitoxin system RelE/ParE family toxin [Chitinivibrionales bacterium]
MSWTIEYYNGKVSRAILRMPSGLLARYVHVTDVMMQFGPNLGMPHTRRVGEKLFEIRLKSREGICRVFYCIKVGRKIVMLHQFIKKSQKTPTKELDTARKRLREVLSNDA